LPRIVNFLSKLVQSLNTAPDVYVQDQVTKIKVTAHKCYLISKLLLHLRKSGHWI